MNKYELWMWFGSGRFRRQLEDAVAHADVGTVNAGRLSDAKWVCGGWDLVGAEPGPRAIDYRSYNKEEIIQEYVDSLLPAPPPSPVPDTFRRIQGRLRIADNGTYFRDDAGYVNPVFAHAGDLFSLYVRDPDWAREEAQSLFEAGYQGVRTWFVLSGGYWENLNRTVNISDWDAIPDFCAMLADEGLRLMASAGDLPRAHSRVEWPHLMRELAALLKLTDPLTVSIDVGNEAYGFSVNSLNAAMAAFMQEYPEVAIRSLTDAPEDDIDRYTTENTTVWDVHGYRSGRMYDKIRHIFSIPWEGAPYHTLGIQSEPWGRAVTQEGGLVSVTSHYEEIDDESHGVATAQRLCQRQWDVWMSSPGVSIRRRGEFRDSPGYEVAPLMASRLRNVMAWGERYHGGESQVGQRIFVADSHEGGLRCDHVAQSRGNGVTIVCYGPPGTYHIPVTRRIRGRWISGDAEIVGPEFEYGPSQLTTVTFESGAVFDGEVV